MATVEKHGKKRAAPAQDFFSKHLQLISATRNISRGVFSSAYSTLLETPVLTSM